jgi:NDP-sugar pyrophosphorylase family protein
MAGEGSRFRTAGYTVPKPFIEVLGKPMIQWVIENVHSSDFQLEYIFLCRKSHIEQYDAVGLFNSLGIHYSIVPVETLTEGAACTVLLAKDKLSLEDPMVIVNSDQFLEWDANVFYTCLLNPTYDGIISTFYSPDPSDTKWSFVKVTPDLFISEVAEKVWLGPNATTGIYGWKKASDFIHYANTMITKNIRTKNEFYVCPVYNEAIQDNKKLRTLDCKKLWGLGIPEDLDIFIQRFAKESDLAV